jgi:hypothetical protein
LEVIKPDAQPQDESSVILIGFYRGVSPTRLSLAKTRRGQE